MPAKDIFDTLTAELRETLTPGHNCALPSMPASAEALTVLATRAALDRTIVWIAEGPAPLETMHRNLLTLARHLKTSECPLLYYPAWETLPDKDVSVDANIAGLRLNVLLSLALQAENTTNQPILTTDVQALIQNTIVPSLLLEHTLTLSVGQEAEMETITSSLNNSGYEFTHEVQQKGEAAVKGGILDVWPSTEDRPIRIEFSGNMIESIRSFNPEDQKSVTKLDSARITARDERLLPHHRKIVPQPAGLLPFLPADTIFFWSDPDGIQEHAATYEKMIFESGPPDIITPLDQLQTRINKNHSSVQISMTAEQHSVTSGPLADFKPVKGVFDIPRETIQPDLMEQRREELLHDLVDRSEKGQSVTVFLDTQGSMEHFAHIFRQRKKNRKPRDIATETGFLSEGFVNESLGLAVVSESDLYGRRKSLTQHCGAGPGRERTNILTGARIADLTDIEPGDLVVHTEHGRGRYMGLFEIMFNGRLQEVLSIEYADNARLHVPVSQAHLLSRYVGTSRHKVELHRLGSKRWQGEKAAAQRSIIDLASLLLETHAQRSLLEGHAFPSDTTWQHEFEASFPYEETADQHRVINEVKHDMQCPRPMERLVCGDAGYGKTEVAMRAAFKAVTAARQVALLVPTTVLAQQHFETFSERMAAYPIRVEMLSRFRSRTRNAAVIRGLKDGTVDIVIGTHALIQPGIKFKNLGLVIIDEEQRFGVVHKERLKEIRRLVDVLTLTATPIPRTLYMSLTGARDMSLMQTPPRERTAVETIAAKNSDKIVREAILRELRREGQVFYLYNRVMTINRVLERLKRLIPEARIDVAHGQMPSSRLSSVMRRFVAGEFDVLLCTTIIESGMDIPRANTILIDRADRFGMADLYQLRGRVGRSGRKAYAYLLLPEHGHVDSDARKRIGAVKKYSSLSAGFSLALRDLEIRGAGNMLGPEQSGHIAAVGFDLYCQLLKRSIAQMKDEKPPPIIDVNLKLDFISIAPNDPSVSNSATIPYTYIEDERLRIDTYRKIAQTSGLTELESLQKEFGDRFGPAPEQVKRLLKIAELKIVCAETGIQELETRNRRLMMRRNNTYVMTHRKFPRLNTTTPDEQLEEIITLAGQLNAECEARNAESPFLPDQ